jgi:RimJ/RimL family protein N-acetyltransferase
VSPQELITPRLRLRRWRSEDAAEMAAINRDPEVARYLNRPVDERAVDAFFEIVSAHWDEHGFGFWALESREPASPGRFLGFVGVAFPTYLPELAARPELGWRLARSEWGRGLATEAAVAARDDAFDRLALDELIAIIHPDNERSQRLAVKLGMSVAQQVHNPLLDRKVDVWRGTSDRAPTTQSRHRTRRRSRARPM